LPQPNGSNLANLTEKSVSYALWHPTHSQTNFIDFPFHDNKTRDFVGNFVIEESDSGQQAWFRTEAKLWIRCFRDSLAEAIHLDTSSDAISFNSMPLKNRWEKICDATILACTLMQNDLHRMEEEAAKLEEQEDVIYDDDNNNNNNKRRRITNKTSSRILLLKADQEFMLSLPANLSSHISPYLVVHIGRILGFQTEPRTSSWIHAGKSFNLYSICNCIFEELSGENTMITHKAKRTSSSSTTTTIINIISFRSSLRFETRHRIV
jgi:hypothetical protein